jgi:hypothetical protein
VALVRKNKDGNRFELVGRPVDFVPHINGGHTVRGRLGSLAPREIDLRHDLHTLQLLTCASASNGLDVG